MTSDVTSLVGQFVRNLLLVACFGLITACASSPSGAAPYAAIVMDARTGETLYSKNADARLHPASLTKMLTLYIAFDAIERGELSLDTMVTVSKNAAAEPPSRLGLKAGQRIAMRHLIRAAAVKSANDAASAIGDHISGSEEKFAARMNRTAKAIGMKNSTFRNANGLTREGHLSTARDMNTLGRRLFYDFPQYYNIFSRRSTDAGLAEVNNTNRRFLDAYKGADGIKTGYTVAAGFNLTGSAERGNTRIIATVFGGTSTAQRNAKMAELLDIGFKSAPANAPTKKPGAPVYEAAPPEEALMAEADEGEGSGKAISPGKTIRMIMAVDTSPRPRGRPGQATAAAEVVNSMQAGIAGALAEATGATPEVFAALEPQAENVQPLAASGQPAPRPAAAAAATIIFTAPEPVPVPSEPEVVTRMSTSGGRHWGINLGRYPSHGVAERMLMKTMLSESATLNDGLRKIVQRGGGYDANFMGLTQEQADLACRRLQARAVQCFAIGP